MTTKLYSTKQIASALHVNIRTVRRMIARGEFPDPCRLEISAKGRIRRFWDETALAEVITLVAGRRKHGRRKEVSTK